MKINEETTVSEEQILFNKLNYEEQQFILKQMRMLQPCELSCEIEEEKKIPEKLDLAWQNAFDEQVQQECIKMILENINTILDYLKSKGDE